MDEVEQTEVEGRSEEKQPKVPNGNPANGTCSPDSGHPSSHNFSSGLSEHSEPSLSTEDSVLDAQRSLPAAFRPGDSSVEDGQSSEATTSRDEAPREELAVQDSLESDLLANESMEEFMSIPGSLDVALPEKDGAMTAEGWPSETDKHGQADSEDNLSEEPEMESLFPALASLAVTSSANNEASPVSSSGVTYSVSHRGSLPEEGETGPGLFPSPRHRESVWKQEGPLSWEPGSLVPSLLLAVGQVPSQSLSSLAAPCSLLR